MRHRKLFLFCPLFAACQLFGQATAPRHALVHEGEIEISGPPLDHVPRFGNGFVVSCDRCQSAGPILWSIDRQGRREEIPFELPGMLSVWQVSSGPDGALAAVGYTFGVSSQFSDFIVWISPDRKRQVVTRVSPFHPYAVTVAPDGTIWAVGPVKQENSRNDLYTNVLRHYDASGSLLKGVILNGLKKYNGRTVVADGSDLMASQDRVGWLTNACQYIEFAFDAVELGRYACPNTAKNNSDVGGFALSYGGDAVVGGLRHGSLAPLELDRASGTWVPTQAPSDEYHLASILGFDGTTLVALSEPTKLRRLSWQALAPGAVDGGRSPDK